ncbi:hypothetical protein LTR05_004809 [Lithohypha guttulata]|uniref:F-box domain-containing protein n=1 Tax=Lithohypha guttulata TaxID=1690604 RepID=A0AAN7T137_9EURO|nr:hypothetical protein LTR05_004809 [Lithohypha guttulata]
MTQAHHSLPKQQQQLTLTHLPTEILLSILSHLYPPWSLEIVHRGLDTTSPTSSFPSITHTLSLTSTYFRTLTLLLERRAFTHALHFRTSATQWRTLTRLKSVSPGRIAWALDHVQRLTFFAPPLFTNRIPWDLLPALKVLELDYCGRSANFRVEGTWEELEGGVLDEMVVRFARDTERFDGPIVEDAWRVDRMRRIEVLVVKRMSVFTVRSVVGEDGDVESVVQTWDLRVTARHRGRLEDVSVWIRDRGVDSSLGLLGDVGNMVIWTAGEGQEGSFRKCVRQVVPAKG